MSERSPITGGETASGPTAFSAIEDVFLDDTFRLHVLDRGGSIRLFDRTGIPVASFGRVGDGPGEFRAPVALVGMGDRHVAVLDRARRLTLLQVGDHAYSLRSTAPLSLTPMDACGWGGGILVLGYGEGKILHLLDEQGASVRSFGQPFRKGSELLAVTSTAGRVACGRSVAAAVSLDAPIVRLYDSTGSLLWEREIEGFRGLIVEPGPDGSVVHRRPEGGMHLNLGVVIVGDTLLVLQTGLFLQGPPDPRAPDSVVTRYYDLTTGRPGGSQAGLPVIGVIRDTLAVAVYGTPAPAFQVIRMTSRVAQ